MTRSEVRSGSTSRSTAGLRAFTLSEVPIGVRLRAKERLLKTDGSRDGTLVASLTFAERVQVGLAAERPSPRVYYVSKKAWDRVMRGAS